LLGQQNPPHSQQICWVSFSPDPVVSSGFLPARAISSHARPSRPLARHFSPACTARVRSTPSILHSASCASVPRFPRRAATSTPCESPCERDPRRRERPVTSPARCDHRPLRIPCEARPPAPATLPSKVRLKPLLPGPFELAQNRGICSRLLSRSHVWRA